MPTYSTTPHPAANDASLPSFLTPANFGDSVSGVGSPADVERRRKLAAALTENGISTAPVESWTQGAARLAQALVGNIQNKRALQEETAGRKSAAAVLAQALQPDAKLDYQAIAANPWIDQQTMMRLPDIARTQRQYSAVDQMLANVPEQDKAMAQAFPQQYTEFKLKQDALAKQAEIYHLADGSGTPQQVGQPSQDIYSPGQIQRGPTFGTPLNRAGNPPPQVQQMAPGDQSQMQPVPQPQTQAMPQQPKSPFDIPIPPELERQADYLAATGQGDQAVKLKEDYRMSMFNRSADSFKNVSSLRNEIQTLPSYKSYAAAIPTYNTMVDAASRDSKAADLNMVYGLAKIYDPNSVVREGETVMVRDTASLPDWLIGSINGLNGGARLLPETRKAMLDEAKSRMSAYKGEFEANMQQYRGLSGRYGINPDDIMPTMPAMGEMKVKGGATSLNPDIDALVQKYANP